MGSVAGKTVLITGGARGVGAEVARRLHAKGANLALTDLDGAAVASMVDELGAERVHAETADVRSLAAMETAAANAIERFGGIDVVMANAGIASYGSVLQVDPEAFQALMDINVMGVFHTVRATLPSVLDRRGYVLIVSSLAAYAAAPGLAPYNASKAAVEHFANALRLEVSHRGVDVGSAHMSWIDTPMVQDTKADLSTFQEMLSKLPFPLNKTTSVQACGRAFVAGIENRRRQINCPGWVGALRVLKPLLSTSLGEQPVRAFVPDLLPRMDAEVAALGRSMSSRTTDLETR
ncbi:short-chain dehydrogenase [Mycolicibacterium chubuense]|uniref:Putative NAD-dependent oxidoreductase n=1 Tax=Mycolicibacterium chubuense TaxID=1800 RepID=A0A0J6WGI3_MYCCU|nr:SDR family oxidoreductase [Mycolicibacterium chubuense]KMO82375.1 putative NAD-dependent oxidoreductase [Mycolicibacterium chubuense]ORA53334.1 short-chain dehydrogenase [Mycolicibacterium chubuense]SPX96485.1 short chain dehydrogenase [Mycolicibacterium chubuense]